MQDYEIKRMSKERIKRELDSINKLILLYKGGKKLNNCPLCAFAACDNCLWNIIEGMNCDVFAGTLYKKPDAEYFRNDRRFRKWKDARLAQLPRWRRILKAELRRRAVKAT